MWRDITHGGRAFLHSILKSGTPRYNAILDGWKKLRYNMCIKSLEGQERKIYRRFREILSTYQQLLLFKSLNEHIRPMHSYIVPSQNIDYIYQNFLALRRMMVTKSLSSRPCVCERPSDNQHAEKTKSSYTGEPQVKHSTTHRKYKT